MQNKIVHAIVATIVFAIPVILSIHGVWQDITIGAILNAVYLYLSQQINPTVSVSPKR